MVAVIAAETSKTPFIIAGAVLVAWALIVAFVGTNTATFAAKKGAARAVMGVSILLVALTMTMAVVTASTPSHAAVSSGRTPASNSVSIAAQASALAYNTKQLALTAGGDTIRFNNPSPIPHNVTIADSGGKVIGATKTITKTSAVATVTLKPGTYVFYCSVDGHRAAGMQGTLTVH